VLVGINAQKLFDSQDYRNAGISRYIRGVCAHLPLVPGDERFVVYTNATVRSWPAVEGRRLRVAQTTLPTLSPIARIAWEQLVLPILAWRDRLDVLHCPLNVLPIASVAAGGLASRVPVVLTIHDLTFVRYPERFHPAKQRYLATFTRYAARHASRIVTDSASTRTDVIEAFGIDPERVDVVYPGVDPDFRPYDGGGESHDAFRVRMGLPERYVLYLGTLEPRKNVDRLVRAFARLVREGLPHTLVLAGGRGWDYAAIDRAMTDEAIGHRVIVPGYVRREDQPLWYSASDLFVYPSQYEGFGLPVLEALACGTPVVTSNSSSLPEVVGRAGISVDPTDEVALADAMRAVLTEAPLAARLREAGPLQASQFTWADAASGCVQAYRRAFADSRARTT
jgi:glycosyltransferase involved in cell wall biosynthesis